MSCHGDPPWKKEWLRFLPSPDAGVVLGWLCMQAMPPVIQSQGHSPQTPALTSHAINHSRSAIGGENSKRVASIRSNYFAIYALVSGHTHSVNRSPGTRSSHRAGYRIRGLTRLAAEGRTGPEQSLYGLDARGDALYSCIQDL